MLTAPRPTDPPAASAVRPAVALVTVSLAQEEQLGPLAQTLVALHTTQPGMPIIVAAGADSAPGLLDQVGAALDALDGDLVRSPGGAVAALNAGLRAALDGGVDVLLIGQDVEVDGSDWLERLRARRDTQGRPAAIVGGRIVDPAGLLTGAGLYFSLLLRRWLPRLQWAPAALPAALVPCGCPVGTGLQLVRWETLAAVGLLDEALTPADANVDFALRAFAAGLESIYEPSAVARCLSPAALPEDPDARTLATLRQSARALRAKHRTTDLTPWTPVTL